ncbi:hypothetical protein [Streptomyces sp. NPDC048521]|uniref:hypothetical protein n=1 Tax=Streptomyces sp. NPDC048521 TaxID=3365566 RepID=UPI00371A9A5E
MSLCLAAAAVLVPVSSPAAHAEAPSSCAEGSADRSFPLATRIHGGPGSYEAGGGYGTWYIDLTNTTRRTCTAVHPVVVLVDDKRALKPDQPKLEFYDGPRTRPVAFESTDEQELVGVLEGPGFGGFTVPPGATLSVKIRLALTSDAVPDQVTANAAVVQRRGKDGDWIGESNAYRFGIDEEGPGGRETPDGPGGRETPDGPGGRETPDGPGAEQSPGGPGVQETPSADGTQDTDGTESTPPGSPRATPGAATPDPSAFFAQDAQDAAAERARELARTGPEPAHRLLAAAATLLAVAGGGAFLLARRRR